jgi:hypothetical protein
LTRYRSRTFASRLRSHRGLGKPARIRSAARPPSLRYGDPTSQLPQGTAYTHQAGRVSARLLLILIHPPHRQAEWRCSSGEWRVAPFDVVEHAACRCSEANRRAVSPDECRSEETPSLGEGPDAGARPLVPLGWAGTPAFAKGTRRKGETIGGRYRSNGYVLNKRQVGCQAAFASRLAPTRDWCIRQNQVDCQAAFAGKPAPTGDWCIRQNQVDCQAAFAGKPAPTGDWVHPPKSGRLSGRLRCDAATRQASSHKGLGASAKIRSAVRPPSLRCGDPTSQLPQGIGASAKIRSAVRPPSLRCDDPASLLPQGSIQHSAFTFPHKRDTKSLQNTELATCQPAEQAYIKAPFCRSAREEPFIFGLNG